MTSEDKLEILHAKRRARTRAHEKSFLYSVVIPSLLVFLLLVLLGTLAVVILSLSGVTFGV